MFLCPFCDRKLSVMDGALHPMPQVGFWCPTCSYRFVLRRGTLCQDILDRTAAQNAGDREPRGAVISEGGAGAYQETSQVRCVQCGATRVAYHQMQTRSADEGMTTFYRCISCGHQWREQ